MSSTWKLLRQSSANVTVPPLLIKYEVGASNYKLWLTDLTHIWAETLAQRPLIQRAWEINSEIDPIEVDQRERLLRHIKDTLDEVKGTKLVLSNENVPDRLTLKGKCPLPKPLKPLIWPFRLALEPQSTLTNELILPLMAQQLAMCNQVSLLLSAIKDKDHVIGKLADKIQSEGVDLGKVFPSAAASKHGSKAKIREHLAKSVPGLGVFDKDYFESQGPQELGVLETSVDLLSRLSAHASGLISFNNSQQSTFGAWWEDLGTEGDLEADDKQDSFGSFSQHSSAKKFQANVPPEWRITQLTILLQRQKTPDQLKKPPSGGHPSPSPSPKQMSLPDRGSIPKNIAQPDPAGDSSTDASDDDSRTENGDLEAVQPVTDMKQSSVERDKSSGSPSPPSIASEPAQASIPKPKGLLGRIGGVARPEISPVKSKLGHIGGAAGQTMKSSKLPSKSPEPRGRSPKNNRSPSPLRETSQERADRKRELLKRELEEKSKCYTIHQAIPIKHPSTQAATTIQHQPPTTITMLTTLITAILAANTFAARVFRPCLVVTLAILRPFHQRMRHFYAQTLATFLISLLLLGSVCVLSLAHMFLWIPLAFAGNSVLVSLISARIWLGVGVPVGMLAYLLCTMDLGLLYLSPPFKGLLSGRAKTALTITWVVLLPVCGWMVYQTCRFRAEVLAEEEGEVEMELDHLATW
ncbi:MAG: hypothetical protein L6R37_002329 [Teloschistes peruensis]|nr:MAG: hypothetical protein L6R37_002329 [Teloschistes peruensis]